jgi:hypothetical protein
MDWKFEVGQRVRKTGGYPFPGVVEGRFLLTQISGERVERYLVNQTTSTLPGEPMTGLGHIFAPEQLVADDRYDRHGVLIKPVRDPRIDPEVAVAEAKAAMLVHQGLKPEDKP